MKIRNCKILVFMLLGLLSINQSLMAAPTGAYDRFTLPINTAWGTDATDVYSITVADGVTVISATDAGGAGKYQSFTYTFPEPIDISNTPSVMVKLKAWWPVDVRIDIQDVNGYSSSEYPEILTTSDDGRFVFYEGMYMYPTHWENGEEVDLTQIEKLVFFFNADGAASYTGDIHIDELFVGDNYPVFDNEDFSDGSLDHGWTAYEETVSGSSLYTLEEDADEEILAASATFSANQYTHYFQYNFYPVDLSDDGTIQFDFKSTSDVTISVDLADVYEKGTANEEPISFEHTGSADFETYSVNMRKYFTYPSSADVERVAYVRFYVNYKGEAFDGTVYIDNLKIGADPNAGTNSAPIVGTIPEQTVKIGGSFADLDLLDYITDPDGDNLDWGWDDGTDLNIDISDDGILSVSPKLPDWIGSEVLYGYVADSLNGVVSFEILYSVEDEFPLGSYNNFEDVQQGSWETGNSYYTASIENGSAKLSVKAAGGPGNYHATAYEFETPVDLSNGAKYFMKIRSADEVDIRIDMEDTEGNSTNADSFFFMPWEDGAFHSVEQEYYRDVTDDITNQIVDMSRIKKLVFYINPDEMTAYTGDIYFDDILVGEYKHNYRIEEFTDASLDGAWNLADQYSEATEANEELTFYADLAEGDYASVAYNFPALDLSKNPYLNISVKSDTDIDVRIDLQDKEGTTSNFEPIVQQLTGDGFYHNLSFDFTGKWANNMTETVDSTDIINAIIMFNPGGNAMTADLAINKLEIGAQGQAPGNQAPRITAIEKVSMVQGDSPVSIDLSDYITDDSTAFADLTLDVAIAKEMTASISAGGMLKIAIADDTWTGTTTASISATDANNLTTEYELSVRVSDGAINPYGYTELFDGMTDSKVSVDEPYTYSTTIVDETLKVTATEAGGSGMYQAVTIDFPNAINITNNRDFSIDIKSAAEFNLRMDLVDANGVVANSDASWVVGYYYEYDNAWFTFSGNYSDVMQNYDGEAFDVTQIAGLMLYVNPDGYNSISADIYFDNIMIGAQTIAENNAPVIDLTLPTEFDIPEGQETYTVDLNKYVIDETPDNLLEWTVSASPSFDIAIVDGIASITPNYTVWLSSEALTFTVIDESDASTELELTFNIGAANEAPEIVAVAEQTKYYNESFSDLMLDDIVNDETADEDITWDIESNMSGYFDAEIINRELIVTAYEGWSESGVITLSATDEQGLSSTIDITFTVYPSVGNGAPEVAAIADQETVLSEAFAPFSIAEYITDETADADLIIRHIGPENLTVGVDELTVYASATDSEWYGTEMVSFEAVDEEGLGTEFTINFIVKPSADNNAPVITQIPDQTVAQEVDFTDIDLSEYVTDETADSDLEWIVNDYTNLTVSITNGVASIAVKDDAWTGSETVTFIVTDAQKAQASIDVVFTVSGGNAAPVVTDIPDQIIIYGESFTDIVLAQYAEDETPDEDLIWSVNETEYFDVNIVSGIATVTAKNKIGWAGGETVTFIVTDEQAAQSTIETIFIIDTPNEAPIVLTIPDQTIYAGESFADVYLPDYVHDIETENAQLSYTIDQTPTSAPITTTLDWEYFTATPADDTWTGSVDYELTVSDEEGAESSVSFSFTILPVSENLAPELSIIPGQSISQGGSFVGMDLSPFVTDETADEDIVWTVTGADKLTATIARGALFVSVSDASWAGTETLTLTATDEGGLSASADVAYTVKEKNTNTAPVLSAIPKLTILKGESFDDFDLAPFVTDETADENIVWTVTGADKLTATIANGVLFLSVSDASWAGTETLTLTATDEGGLSASADVAYTVKEKDTNTAPVLSAIPKLTILKGDSFDDFDLAPFVTDETADENIVWEVFGGTNLSPSVTNGMLSVAVLDADFTGSEIINLTAYDEAGLSATVNLVLEVEYIDTEDPVVDPISDVTANEDGSIPAIDLSDYVQNDSDAANLTYSIDVPAELTYTIDNGILTVEPADADWSGSADVTVTVTDAAGNETEVSFTVTVAAEESEAPVIVDIPAVETEAGGSTIINLSDYISDDKDGLIYSFNASDNIIIKEGKDKVMVSAVDGFEGTETISVSVTDADGNTATTEITVVFGEPTVTALELDVKVSVYPNPATDYISIELAGSSSAHVVITDAKGSVVSQFYQTEQTQQVNLSNIASGLYLVTVCTELSQTVAPLTVK